MVGRLRRCGAVLKGFDEGTIQGRHWGTAILVIRPVGAASAPASTADARVASRSRAVRGESSTARPKGRVVDVLGASELDGLAPPELGASPRLFVGDCQTGAVEEGDVDDGAS